MEGEKHTEQLLQSPVDMVIRIRIFDSVSHVSPPGEKAEALPNFKANRIKPTVRRITLFELSIFRKYLPAMASLRIPKVRQQERTQVDILNGERP